jgi:carbonic anhydrase
MPALPHAFSPWSVWQVEHEDHGHGALPALLAGVRENHRRSMPEVRPHLEHLIHGQQPQALLLTCTDSRVVANVLTSSGPGDLYTVRNLGNLVPPSEHESESSVAASLEYAVNHLNCPRFWSAGTPAARRCTACSAADPSPARWAGGCTGACRACKHGATATPSGLRRRKTGATRWTSSRWSTWPATGTGFDPVV